KRTRNIPITILKNANKDSHYAQAEEFLLKESVTSDLLSRSITNSIRLKRMQQNVAMFYSKKKSQLSTWFG
ncbi:hypothetical protein, partial [Fulvivirga aurantia]|uniref:hypothetical protein n=1 Tax=Fulvivirga aurantia TaxID=2529383 RepID=UPI001628CAE4